jgi:hypothetical protein
LGIHLTPGKGMKASQEGKFLTPLYPEDFRVSGIGGLSKKDYGGGVFWNIHNSKPEKNEIEKS